jgi:hypothetical protein
MLFIFQCELRLMFISTQRLEVHWLANLSPIFYSELNNQELPNYH